MLKAFFFLVSFLTSEYVTSTASTYVLICLVIMSGRVRQDVLALDSNFRDEGSASPAKL